MPPRPNIESGHSSISSDPTAKEPQIASAEWGYSISSLEEDPLELPPSRLVACRARLPSGRSTSGALRSHKPPGRAGRRRSHRESAYPPAWRSRWKSAKRRGSPSRDSRFVGRFARADRAPDCSGLSSLPIVAAGFTVRQSEKSARQEWGGWHRQAAHRRASLKRSSARMRACRAACS